MTDTYLPSLSIGFDPGRQIGIPDRKESETVDIDIWDCQIEIRTMSAKQRADILEKVMDKDGKINSNKLTPHMIIASCFDPETGERVFSDEDSEWLMDKSSGPIEKIMSIAMKMSGLTKDAFEDAEKN